MNSGVGDSCHGVAPVPESGVETRSRYVVAARVKLEPFLRELASRYPTRRHAPARLERIYLDTFDRRLAENGLTLSLLRTNGENRLVMESAGGARHYAPSAGLPALAADLPAGPIRQRLRSIIASRRLLALVRVKGQTQTIDILAKCDKTAGRITIERLAASPPNGKLPAHRLATELHLEATRGFESAIRPVLDLIEARNGISRTGGSVLGDALGAIGETAEPPSSKKRHRLHAHMRTDEAMKKILAHLLESMEANESGVRSNLDPEFLHDFRVAIRRMQCALAQLKDVFPPESVRHFRAEFKWLREITNPVRDLDVQLLQIDQALAANGEYRQQDLEPLVRYLTDQNQTHRQRMVAALDSDRYRIMLNDWRKFLEEPVGPDPVCINASRDILDVAQESIRSGHRLVLEHARDINDATPAKKLHRLRIACKKLRYLLEYFSELFEPNLVHELTRALKRLQDHLGKFQDLQVQRETLEYTAYEMGRQGPVPIGTLLAVGQMMHQLELRQRKLRKRFSRKFIKFRKDAKKYRLNPHYS